MVLSVTVSQLSAPSAVLPRLRASQPRTTPSTRPSRIWTLNEGIRRRRPRELSVVVEDTGFLPFGSRPGGARGRRESAVPGGTRTRASRRRGHGREGARPRSAGRQEVPTVVVGGVVSGSTTRPGRTQHAGLTTKVDVVAHGEVPGVEHARSKKKDRPRGAGRGPTYSRRPASGKWWGPGVGGLTGAAHRHVPRFARGWLPGPPRTGPRAAASPNPFRPVSACSTVRHETREATCSTTGRFAPAPTRRPGRAHAPPAAAGAGRRGAGPRAQRARPQLPPAGRRDRRRRGLVGHRRPRPPLPRLPRRVLRPQLRTPPPRPGRRGHRPAGEDHAHLPGLRPRAARALRRGGDAADRHRDDAADEHRRRGGGDGGQGRPQVGLRRQGRAGRPGHHRRRRGRVPRADHDDGLDELRPRGPRRLRAVHAGLPDRPLRRRRRRRGRRGRDDRGGARRAHPGRGRRRRPAGGLPAPAAQPVHGGRRAARPRRGPVRAGPDRDHPRAGPHRGARGPHRPGQGAGRRASCPSPPWSAGATCWAS